MTFQERQVVPPRPVELFEDGRWHRGQLMAWRLSRRGLRARVREITGIGHVLSEPRWVDARLVRPRALSPELCLEPFEERYVDNG